MCVSPAKRNRPRASEDHCVRIGFKAAFCSTRSVQYTLGSAMCAPSKMLLLRATTDHRFKLQTCTLKNRSRSDCRKDQRFVSGASQHLVKNQHSSDRGMNLAGQNQRGDSSKKLCYLELILQKKGFLFRCPASGDQYEV